MERQRQRNGNWYISRTYQARNGQRRTDVSTGNGEHQTEVSTGNGERRMDVSGRNERCWTSLTEMEKSKETEERWQD